MTFVYPLGLLGLIAIPVLIVIYVLQSKYNEQTVPSTYLWHLSEKFLKRRNPLSGLTGIISLILQILTVALISLALARPIVTLPGAAKDYHFVLDSSASMSTSEDGVTRFEFAKGEIEKIIEDSVDGSTYSLTLVSAEEVVAFTGVSDKKTALSLLGDATSNHTALTEAEILSAAQSVLDGDSSTLIYVLTDMSFTEIKGAEVITVGNRDTENYSVSGLEYSHMGSRLSASVELISHSSDAGLTIRLLVDGTEIVSRLAADGMALDSNTVSVKSGVAKRVELTADVSAFSSFTVEVTNSDGYPIDNTVTAHNLESDSSYSILIVSESGFFLNAAADALLDSDVKLIDPDDYETETGEYGLYIFEGYTPNELPSGSVWLVNCDKNIEKSGFDVRARVALPEADVIEKSSSTATATRALLEGVSGKDIYIKNYIKYSGMYLKFQTLFSYDGNPLIFAGTNGVGARQVVFGFDLNESDFALSADFITLLENLLAYSFPDVINHGNYTVGDEATVNIIPNTSGYRAESPSDRDVFIDDSSSVAGIILDEVGTYTVYATVYGKEIPYRIFSAADPEESKPQAIDAPFVLFGERTDGNIDGKYDPTGLIFVLLAVLFIADWGVYLYEKYQLR